MTLRVDPRSALERRDELRRIAESAAAAGGPDWAAILFPAGELAVAELPGQTAPDVAVLLAALDAHAGLGAHLDALPEALRLHWLSATLGIQRRGPVPDRVIVSVAAEPARRPITVPAGTAMRGGKDVTGAERRYETSQPLTVHGGTLLRVQGYRVISPVQDRTAQWAPGELPKRLLAADGPDTEAAAHVIRMTDSVFAFEGGEMSVLVNFGTAHSREVALEWWYSAPGHPAKAVATPGPAGWTVVLRDGCVGGDFGGPWIEARISAETSDFAGDIAATFRSPVVSVTKRTLRPDRALANGGNVDMGREFQPFGPTPSRGDSFAIASEEAFSKPLARLTITLSQAVGSRPWLLLYDNGFDTVGALAVAISKSGRNSSLRDKIFGKYQEPGPKLLWQRRRGGDWQELGSADPEKGFTSFSVLPPDGGLPHSDPLELGGKASRFVRAYLSRGDFGWSEYLHDLAARKADDPVVEAPTPPLLDGISLSYETSPKAPHSVTVTNGWATNPWPADSMSPFGLTLPPPQATISFALDIPDAGIGAALSAAIDVDPAPLSEALADGESVWERWTSARKWERLDVVDGTHGLRQPGVLQLATDALWQPSAGDGSGPVARWVRLRTNAPDRIGTIRAVHLDAVTATYRSRLPDPARDATPALSLRLDELTGLVTPIPGVVKVTAVGTEPGRGPEDDDAYAVRATALTRHRARAVQPWDYEQLVRTQFPEVAIVRALRRLCGDAEPEPGVTTLVIAPATTDPRPTPTVGLAERVEEFLLPRMPIHSSVSIVAPRYTAVTLDGVVLLARGVPGMVGRDRIRAALEQWLQPIRGEATEFGAPLYASDAITFLESLADVDRLVQLALRVDDQAVDVVTPESCRGLVASSGAHRIEFREQM